MVSCFESLVEEMKLSSNSSLNRVILFRRTSMPNSLEACIQQSLKAVAEVVRDVPPAMSASVRKTASSCLPERVMVKIGVKFIKY